MYGIFAAFSSHPQSFLSIQIHRVVRGYTSLVDLNLRSSTVVSASPHGRSFAKPPLALPILCRMSMSAPHHCRLCYPNRWIVGYNLRNGNYDKWRCIPLLFIFFIYCNFLGQLCPREKAQKGFMETFDQNTFDIVARAALFIFESSG